MLAHAAETTTALTTIATPQLWAITFGAIILLLTLDFIVTRKPHEVSFREAVGWSIFYIALPVLFGFWVWNVHGSETGIKYYTGYIVEKSLSVDNLFVFILIMGAFAVPRVLQQRVLLIGVIGALVLRGVFIYLGAAMIEQFTWTFVFFGALLIATAVKVLRDAMSHEDQKIEPDDMRIVRILRRFWPVTKDYHGTRYTVIENGRRALTPFALVIAAIIVTDVIFAIDSVPAVYGITSDPYLVFVTNAFALLGLRALYFVLEGALSKLVYLGFGLAAILAFIGVKLVLHWAHGVWPQVPEIHTTTSLLVIVGILAITTIASLRKSKQLEREAALSEPESP
jgi:tellurite resistance protein TerC